MLAELLAQVGTNVDPPTQVQEQSGAIGFPAPYSDPTGLPGASTGVGLVNGIIFYSLLLTLVGIVLSAGLWAVGSFSNNYTQSINGKKGFLICAGAAMAIGAAFFMTKWFFGAGQGVS